MPVRLAALACAVAVCLAAPPAAAQPPTTSGRDDASLPLALDRNADPRIVEIDLEARVSDVEIAPGERYPLWTYNGGLPGPLLRARLGDRLIVHFTNHLPEPTTVHWHGVRVPLAMDGVPEISQPAVAPGATFTYDFIVPDAGLFWYHPHVMSAAQVGFGLYGALLVDDPADGVGVADERVLVLSDLAIDAEGRLEPADSGGPAGMVFGREGDRVLVNGRRQPLLRARRGAPQRWRIVNAAKSRYFDLDLDGESFVQIGGDGGLQESPTTSRELVIAPGERVDVVVAPTGDGSARLVLRSLLFNRGYGSVEYREAQDLLTLEFDDQPALPPVPPPTMHRVIEPLSAEGATPVQVVLTLQQRGDSDFDYGINGVPFPNRPIAARPGETQLWTVVNKTKWSHPLHLHGFFFQVLDASGQPVRPLAWKDTVDVPFEQTVRLLVRFDDRAGLWMYHCHILDHADGGLMGTVAVGVPATVPSAHVH